MAKRFPNESDEYRAARDQLLKAEADLREQTERVAKLRRSLPLGGEVKEDYVFSEQDASGTAKQVRLSELFAPGKDTLFLYGFMFGPDVEQPCPLCTSILDALDGEVPHLLQRVNVAVAAKSPIQRIREFARSRGWRNLRLLSSADNTYNADYFTEDEQARQMPMANVFVRRDGKIHHFWGSELLYAPAEGDTRHVDTIWPLWHVFDLTPEGRGDFYPAIRYE